MTSRLGCLSASPGSRIFRARSYGWNSPVGHAPNALISKWHIEPGAAVLDLGCESDELSLWIRGKVRAPGRGDSKPLRRVADDAGPSTRSSTCSGALAGPRERLGACHERRRPLIIERQSWPREERAKLSRNNDATGANTASGDKAAPGSGLCRPELLEKLILGRRLRGRWRSARLGCCR